MTRVQYLIVVSYLLLVVGFTSCWRQPETAGTQLVPLALAVALPLVAVFATQMPLKDALLKGLAPLIGL
jgi:hypothetical protein